MISGVGLTGSTEQPDFLRETPRGDKGVSDGEVRDHKGR